MNKKRRAALVMALFLATVGSATAARAEAEFDGEVVASETQVISVPCSGQLESIEVQEGQWVSEGEAVAEMKVNKVFATTDGTVRGIFYQVGDSLESGAGASGQTTGSAENAGGEDNSQSADGTVMYIAPVSRYTVNATIDDAYNRAANKYVRIGETVYMKCVKDGSHRAVGTIVAVDGSGYTVETTGGELYMEETVYIYRDSDYSSSTRIGSGTVTRTQEVAVQGTGTLLKLYVEDGEEVERGQLRRPGIQHHLCPYQWRGGLNRGPGGGFGSARIGAGQTLSGLRLSGENFCARGYALGNQPGGSGGDPV